MALSKAERDKKYRETHKEQLAEYFRKRWQEPERQAKNKLYKQLQRFGLNADEFVKGKHCFGCGVQNEIYKVRTGRRLDINHIDDNGRKALRFHLTPNNSTDNFMVACRSCHVRWHNRNIRIYGNRDPQPE